MACREDTAGHVHPLRLVLATQGVGVTTDTSQDCWGAERSISGTFGFATGTSASSGDWPLVAPEYQEAAVAHALRHVYTVRTMSWNEGRHVHSMCTKYM